MFNRIRLGWNELGVDPIIEFDQFNQFGLNLIKTENRLCKVDLEGLSMDGLHMD